MKANKHGDFRCPNICHSFVLGVLLKFKSVGSNEYFHSFYIFIL